MRHRPRTYFSLTIMIAVLAGLWIGQTITPAHAAPDSSAFVINLTSGKSDLHAVTMGLQLAGHALDDGRTVTVFLNVRGVEFAGKSFSDKLAFGGNPPIQTMLRNLMQRGATVLVCPACMKALDMDQSNLLDGVRTASREQLFGPLGGDSVVFTY